MPLFECTGCHCVENTAVCNFWTSAGGGKALCSECDPAIGRWHLKFEKRPAADVRAKNPEEFKMTDQYIAAPMSMDDLWAANERKGGDRDAGHKI